EYNNYSLQLTRKSDSKSHALVTIAILGQPPSAAGTVRILCYTLSFGVVCCIFEMQWQ
ncbi:MAG: hypothetical protein ACI8UP_003500, partial [Porticoccaceae bacterium]